MENLMKIAVYGANGFQGKLTAPALMRRQIEPVLVGRNHARLSLAADELGLSAAKLSIANESDQMPCWTLLIPATPSSIAQGPSRAISRCYRASCLPVPSKGGARCQASARASFRARVWWCNLMQMRGFFLAWPAAMILGSE
jgi:short subunit dehydrogenase-like uncharacterized protein